MIALFNVQDEKKSLFVDILHLRFDGNTCKEPAAKLTLILNFKIFFFVLYSTHHEGKTFPRNLIVLLKNGEKVFQSFNAADA